MQQGSVITILGSCLFAALTAVGVTQLVRAAIEFLGFGRWLRKKPIGCNLCMSFWSGALATVFLFDYPHQVILVVCAMTYLLLTWSWKPPQESIAALISGDEAQASKEE